VNIQSCNSSPWFYMYLQWILKSQMVTLPVPSWMSSRSLCMTSSRFGVSLLPEALLKIYRHQQLVHSRSTQRSTPRSPRLYILCNRGIRYARCDGFNQICHYFIQLLSTSALKWIPKNVVYVKFLYLHVYLTDLNIKKPPKTHTWPKFGSDNIKDPRPILFASSYYR
jgi:hypothetical protein